MAIKGIYHIINTVNNYRYIGSSISIERRFKEHRRDLINNVHDNIKLQNAWNKYGEEFFTFNIVDALPDFIDRQKVLKIEQFFLDSSNFNQLYNICTTVTNDGTGKIHEDLSKDKMSDHKRQLSKNSNKGIRFRKTKAGSQYYEVNIKRRNESIYLGRYNTYEEALQARLKGEDKYWHNNEEYLSLSKEDKSKVFSNISKNNKIARRSGSGITLKSSGTYQVQFYIKSKKCYFSGIETYEEALKIRLDLEAKYWTDKPVEVNSH